MSPRKKKKQQRGSGIPGLTRRGERAYYSRTMPEAVGGDRLFRSIDAPWGSELAAQRAGVLNTFWDRGDWSILRRWANGDVHISELQRALREGDFGSLRILNAQGVLLEDGIRPYLQRVEATSARNTHHAHEVLCDALIRDFGPKFPMHEMTVDKAEGFLHAPRRDGNPWSPNTQKAYKVKAGALWQYIIDREREQAEQRDMESVFRRNPWKQAKIKDGRKKRPLVLTEAGIVALLNNREVYDTPKEAFLAVAALAGLRQQEIAHIRRDMDLTLDGPKPFIRVQSRAGEYEWDTKTVRSERDVPITPTLVAILRRHIRQFSGARYVFTAPGKDRPVSRSTAEGWTKKAYAAAGIKYGRDEGDGITLHGLRHSHATILLSQGASLAAVAKRLGDTKEVVLETYAHVLPEDDDLILRITEASANGEQYSPFSHHSEEKVLGHNKTALSRKNAENNTSKSANPDEIDTSPQTKADSAPSKHSIPEGETGTKNDSGHITTPSQATVCGVQG